MLVGLHGAGANYQGNILISLSDKRVIPVGIDGLHEGSVDRIQSGGSV